MKSSLKLGLLVAGIVAVAIAASYLKRSEIYLLSLFCVYLMATFGLTSVGYAGQMSLGRRRSSASAPTSRRSVSRPGFRSCSCCRSRGRVFRDRAGAGLPLRVQHHYLAFATLGFSVLVYLGMRNEEEDHRRAPSESRAFLGPRCWASRSKPEGLLLFHAGVAHPAGVVPVVARCARRGRAFARCATIRSAPRVLASISRRTRCSRSRSAPPAPASAASTSRRWSEFIEPGPFHFSTSLMMLLAVIVGGSGRFFGPVIGTVIIILLPEVPAPATSSG